MNPRDKHSFSSDASGFSGGRTKVVYGRRGFGAGPGIRRFSARQVRWAIVLGLVIAPGLIGEVFAGHHHRSLDQTLRQVQSTLPTIGSLNAQIEVEPALLGRDIYPDKPPICPDNEPNVAGHSFFCTFAVQGRPERVRVTVSADRQTLIVGKVTAR